MYAYTYISWGWTTGNNSPSIAVVKVALWSKQIVSAQIKDGRLNVTQGYHWVGGQDDR